MGKIEQVADNRIQIFDIHILDRISHDGERAASLAILCSELGIHREVMKVMKVMKVMEVAETSGAYITFITSITCITCLNFNAVDPLRFPRGGCER